MPYVKDLLLVIATQEATLTKQSLTAIVLTRNEETHLKDCLESIRWVDNTIVFDSYSTDRTLEIATSMGAKFIQHAFENYGAQRNAAMAVTSTEWVLFIDADERVSPELAEELMSKLNRPEDAWAIPRHNWIFGKLTRGAGWFPDFQTRLLRKDRTRYDPAYPVHEVVVVDGTVGYLESPLTHLNYETVNEFLEKQRRYTEIAANELFRSGKHVRPRMLISMPVREFYRRFIAERGYIDGLHGFRLSLLMAYFEFYKWRTVSERWRTNKKG